MRHLFLFFVVAAHFVSAEADAPEKNEHGGYMSNLDADLLYMRKAIAEYVTFSQRYSMMTPKCQPLTNYLHMTVTQFFVLRSDETGDRVKEDTESRRKASKEYAQKIGCEQANDIMWFNFDQIGSVVDAAIKQQAERNKQPPPQPRAVAG